MTGAQLHQPSQLPPQPPAHHGVSALAPFGAPGGGGRACLGQRVAGRLRRQPAQPLRHHVTGLQRTCGGQARGQSHGQNSNQWGELSPVVTACDFPHTSPCQAGCKHSRQAAAAPPQELPEARGSGLGAGATAPTTGK